MKKFETPVVELVKFSVMDVVTTSDPNPCLEDYGLPEV